MAAVSSRRVSSSALVILAAIFIGAFGLRVWDLNAPSIWHDEAWSIRAVRDPVNTPDDKTPALYYALVHILWLGAGETPLALRYGSVLLDLITIGLAVRLMQRWASRDAGLLAAFLFALSPLLWAYAREVRAYVAVPLLVIVLLDLIDRLLANSKPFPWRIWGTLLAAELALLYTHNLSVPVVAWLNAVAGGVWIWQRQWRALMIWGMGQAALLIAYLPWLLSQAPSGTPLNTPPALNLALAWDIWQSFFAPVPAQLGQETALVIASAVFGGVFAVSIVVIVAARFDRRALLLVSQIVLLPVLVVIQLHIAHIDFHPRYFIPVLPAVLLVIVMAVYRLPHGTRLHRVAAPLVLAGACAAAAASFTSLLTKAQYQHDDFRAVAEYYATLPPEAIIVVPYGWEPALEVYYVEKLNIRARVVGIDLHSTLDEAVEALNAALAGRDGPIHVELLTWFQLPADWRGMYSCMLGAAGRPDSALTVYGITTQAYTLEGPVVWQESPAPEAEYGVVGLEGPVRVVGKATVCVSTRWTLHRATKDDWRVVARLVADDLAGWEIARGDADMRSVEQVPTSDLEPGDQAEAFVLLEFPEGSPPGQYAVRLGVYSAGQPSGLDRLVNGVPAGRSLPLTAITLDRPVTRGGALLENIPSRLDQEIVEGVTLVGHDAQSGTLAPGQELRTTLFWQVDSPGDTWAMARLVLAGDSWEIAQPIAAYAPYSQDWHLFRVPPEAAGNATLALVQTTGDAIELADYALVPTDHLFAQPAFDVPVGAVFGDLAALVGFSAGPVTLSPDESLRLTLVWQAQGTGAESYRVFTHLLDADSRVIAQHDGYPVNGERLTTGWVVGEYVVDTHDLTFLPEGRAYRGPARLEVGLYNPDTGYRVPVAGGADHVLLPLEITVQ